MSSHREEIDLAAALRELRPTPRPEFGEQLDARAAAGFPDKRRGSARNSWLGKSARRLRLRPSRRRLLAGAGGLALTAIALATAVIAVSEHGASVPSASHLSNAGPLPIGRAGARAAPGMTSGSETRSGAPTAPSGAEGESEAGEVASGASFNATRADRSGPDRTGPYASRNGNRDVERGAAIVLAADPSSLRADSAQVFEAVHAANGIVLHSTIRDGSHGDAGASFDLLIPSARLDEALAAFSGIAEVRSRHESTEDITAPTVGVGERLQDSHARVESLLTQLAGADTEGERAQVEAELRTERGRAAALRSRLSTLQRRANLSRVSLRIETEPGGEGGASGWGVGNGLDDAGRILAIAAGVALIGLALLAPLAAIALLGWLARRAWLRRARSNALA